MSGGGRGLSGVGGRFDEDKSGKISRDELRGMVAVLNLVRGGVSRERKRGLAQPGVGEKGVG